MRPYMEQPEIQNRRLDLTGLTKPGETCGLMGTGPPVDRQEAAGRVVRHFWKRIKPFFRYKPRLLASYPYPLLTLRDTLELVTHSGVASVVRAQAVSQGGLQSATEA